MPAAPLRRALLVALAALALAALTPRAAAQVAPPPAMGAVSDYLYPHLHNLIWDPADPAHVYATSPMGGWESRDGGRSWRALSPDTPNLHYGRALLEPQTRTLYLYRWGDSGLYRSTDFGASWALRHRGLLYDAALVPGRPGALYAVHGDLRIRRSDDGGASWVELGQPARRPRELTLAVAPSGVLFAIADRQLYRSEDGGWTWPRAGAWPADARPRELLAAADGSLVATVASDDVPSVSARALLRSGDGGRSWAAAALPAPRIAVAAVAPDGGVWAGSDDGRVWRSVSPQGWAEAGGWRELPLQLARPRALPDGIPYTPAITEIAPGPGGAVLIGTIHGIYRAASPEGPALLRARGLTPTGPLPSTPGGPAAGARYFPETGQSLPEPFLSAWERAGGLATLGFPHTAPFVERNLDTGQEELTVYFERGRLGQPLAGGPVSLGRVGPPLMAEAGLRPGPAAPRRGCLSFPATGQRICEPFLGLWRKTGGEAFLGLPLSSPEAGEAQWFERGRLERNEGASYLCLIGNEELQARGWLP